MTVPIEELAAEWAPLSRPLLQRLTSLVQVQHWDELQWQMGLQRSNIFDRFHPTVMLHHDVTVGWSLAELSSVLQKKFARSTFYNWHDRGFIRLVGRGYPDPQDIARLLFYFAVLKAYRVESDDVLPATLDEQEWWCWSQESPRTRPIPFRFFSEERSTASPPATRARGGNLFWTSWPGAAWDERWLQVGGLGAITCGYLLFSPPGTLDHVSFMDFLNRWQLHEKLALPYFRDLSHHGHKLMRYEIPARYLEIALWLLAQSRLVGPTFH